MMNTTAFDFQNKVLVYFATRIQLWKKGFEESGLSPFDRNKFMETMFLPSTVTNQDHANVVETSQSSEDVIKPVETTEQGVNQRSKSRD
ncbi:hypothetical protein U1Q18_052018 [Sarracenia purpurea var. burkii]